MFFFVAVCVCVSSRGSAPKSAAHEPPELFPSSCGHPLRYALTRGATQGFESAVKMTI